MLIGTDIENLNKNERVSGNMHLLRKKTTTTKKHLLYISCIANLI
jgi:hypothetical protein